MGIISTNAINCVAANLLLKWVRSTKCKNRDSFIVCRAGLLLSEVRTQGQQKTVFYREFECARESCVVECDSHTWEEVDWRQYPGTWDEKMSEIIEHFSIAGLHVKKSSKRLPRGVINVSRCIFCCNVTVWKVMWARTKFSKPKTLINYQRTNVTNKKWRYYVSFNVNNPDRK
jgi:hypothetical protein